VKADPSVANMNAVGIGPDGPKVKLVFFKATKCDDCSRVGEGRTDSLHVMLK